MSDLDEIIMLVVLHHEDHPDHGVDCACMDQWVQKLRRMFTTGAYPEAQRRVDYVLRKALER